MASNETDYSDDSYDDFGSSELENLFVIPLYVLSFFVGIPANGYIIYRLYVRGVSQSNYYKLLMVMSAIDIYIAFFNLVEYYNSRVMNWLHRVKR